MVEVTYRQRPLAHLGLAGKVKDSLGDAGLGMSDGGFRAILNLRADLAKQPGVRDAFEKAMGFALPETANTANGKGNAVAFWLGPNEWQIVVHDAAPDAGTRWLKTLREGLQGHFCAVVDVSHAQAVVVVTGPMTREVLERAVPLDMDPRAFKPGEVKQTLFGRNCGVTLHLLDDTPTVEIYCRRSFAEYIWIYLRDCARGAETHTAVLAG